MRSQFNYNHPQSQGTDRRLQFVSGQSDTGNFDVEDIPTNGQNFFGRIKERLIDLVFEPAEYPVGINQLNRKTFRSATPNSKSPYFKNQNQYQQFRFPQLMESNHHDFTR